MLRSSVLALLFACGAAAPSPPPRRLCAPGWVVACTGEGTYAACVDGELVDAPCSADVAVCEYSNMCRARDASE
jgi:hypothetical protein